MTDCPKHCDRTDPALNPSSPPSSFILPPPTVTYTSSPTKSDPQSRLKITTEWKWLDPEWSIVRSSSQITSSASSSSLSSPLATLPPAALPTSTSGDLDPYAPAGPSALPLADPVLFNAWAVDPQGWQYGDNHFEKMSAKGGLGKYTRRRAWVRRAGLVERCEREAGSAGATFSSSAASSNLSSSVVMGTAIASGGGAAARQSSVSRRERKLSREKGEDGSPSASVRRRKSSSRNSLKGDE